MKKAEDRIGMTNKNKQGDTMTIIDYVNARDMRVKFTTGEVVKCDYKEFKNGSVVSRFYPSVQGIGVYGLKRGEESNKRRYDCWVSMLKRCYDSKFHEKEPSYKECEVCEEWLYYPNFRDWYNENYYEIEGERMCLDKDILVKGNKVYSPETCIFAPQRINTLFVKNNANRGDLPIGVQLNENKSRYIAICKTGKRVDKRIGTYDTMQEAFDSYKHFKQNYIKQVANKYKDKIPEKLYRAMYNHKIEITD